MTSFEQSSFFDDQPSSVPSSSGADDTVDAPSFDSGSAEVPEGAADDIAADIGDDIAAADEAAPAPSDPPAAEEAQPQEPVTTDAETQLADVGTTLPEDLEESAFFAAPAAVDGVMADPGQEAVDAFFGPTRLDRPRPVRPPLIPRWTWVAGAIALGLLVIALVAVLAAGSLANISVPKLTGIDVDTARARLAQEGLKLAVSERRFSPSAAGVVLAQTPAASTKLKRGDTVTVVISAGSEQFAMPNVVGDGLLLARGLLETKGLDVRIEKQPSQQPSDTVLASNPPAGTAVHTGDIVRLTIAAPGPDTSLLLPYDLSGVTVVIDPTPVNDAQTDVPLDIARRLRSLVEASHGTVVATRALAETSTLETVAARANRAAAGTATVAIGLSTVPGGTGGLVVLSPSPVLAHATASAKLASRIASDLAVESGTPKSATSTTDTVLSAADSPWARVQLGSFGQREDVAKFTDSVWEDAVARGLYRSIAALYGKKIAVP